MLAIALRVLGAALILAALLFPRAEAQAAQTPIATRAAPHALAADDDDDGGECGEHQQVESIDCGDKLTSVDPRPDEPFAIALLRTVELHTLKMSERACTELLTDIWSQESCQAQGRECGKIHTGAPPGPGPKLASSSSSAQSIWAGLGLCGANARPLARSTNVRGPSSRDLEPPVPPPRLLGH
jgi:hypothetical protein